MCRGRINKRKEEKASTGGMLSRNNNEPFEFEARGSKRKRAKRTHAQGNTQIGWEDEDGEREGGSRSCSRRMNTRRERSSHGTVCPLITAFNTISAIVLETGLATLGRINVTNQRISILNNNPTTAAEKRHFSSSPFFFFLFFLLSNLFLSRRRRHRIANNRRKQVFTV